MKTFVSASLLLVALVASAFAQNPYNPPAPDPSEAGKINQIYGGIQDLMTQAHNKGSNWLRMAHAKQHGCVRAFIQTLPNLPPYAAQGPCEEFRVSPHETFRSRGFCNFFLCAGLFNTATQNSSHVALIRFSNGIGSQLIQIQACAQFHAGST